ncbi:VWA domain-containing protein [Pseudarcicella hirudinis]|uniref:vWA domain-containing protein n=1 Tax=Pseudarcicella hirudinis TaxID=1079859 RepID=UPI0035F0E4DF
MMEDTTGRKYSLSFRLLDIKGGNRTPVKGDYNAFLLLDQSGSTDDTDPDNLRIRSSQIFLESMGNNDKVALGSFTTGQLYPSLSGNVHLHGGFNAKGTTFYPALDSLKNTILKGNTPLFTSTAWAINYTAANAKAQNKVVILFTDGQNNGGSSQSAVESLSLQKKKVPVYTVGLSTDVGFDVLNNMALNTGGSFMWAKDAKQLISYFGTLGNLLRGNAEYYTLTFEASAGSLPTFSKLLYLQVSLPNGKKFWMPYVIKLA